MHAFSHTKADLSIQVSMGMSCILGLAVSHSTFVCTRVNDPLMTSTAGNLKNIIMTIIGAFAFGDFRFSLWNSVGLLMSMVGAIWYAARSALKVRLCMFRPDFTKPDLTFSVEHDKTVVLQNRLVNT